MTRDVMIVIGAGGMGMACARRLGPGRHVLLADPDATGLLHKADILRQEGLIVTAHTLDISDCDAVSAFALQAATLGPLHLLLQTAGLSPGNNDADAIMAVNLIGTSHLLDAFVPFASAATVGIVISSIAAYIIALPSEVEQELAQAPTSDLLATVQAVPGWDDPVMAYSLSKRVNQLQVEARALAWGAQGARLLSISPGVIATPMFHQDRVLVEGFEAMAHDVPAARLGTAQDIAAAVEWLASPLAGFITGCDLRIDGGMIAMQRWAERQAAT